jgi:hypothetical protein
MRATFTFALGATVRAAPRTWRGSTVTAATAAEVVVRKFRRLKGRVLAGCIIGIRVEV